MSALFSHVVHVSVAAACTDSLSGCTKYDEYLRVVTQHSDSIGQCRHVTCQITRDLIRIALTNCLLSTLHNVGTWG